VLVVRRNDQVVCMLSTSMVQREPLTLSGEGVIDFTIDELPLVGGTYTIGALIRLSEGDADVLYGAIEMEVIDGDFFGTGKVRPFSDWSNTGTLVRHRFEVRPAQPPRKLVGVDG
jgi:lipopolysaccharide transport system ATP-binding protein